LNAWGIARLGQRLDAYLETLFTQLPFYRAADNEGGVFFWTDKQQADSYGMYRTNSEREAQDIAPAEAANAMRQILREQISLPTSDLARLAAQHFGFAHMGTNVEAAMRRGMDAAVHKGFCKIENERAVVL
jgi:hypothetical protein